MTGQYSFELTNGRLCYRHYKLFPIITQSQQDYPRFKLLDLTIIGLCLWSNASSRDIFDCSERGDNGLFITLVPNVL